MADPFLGQITAYGFNFAPYGWATCSGQLLPISQYAALFSLLGTNFGGNGTSNFGLPNLQGNVPLGAGISTTGTTYDLGEMGGEAAVTLLSTQIPTHTHALNANNQPAGTMSPTGAVPAQGPHIGGRGAGSEVNLYAPSGASGAVALAPAACALAGGGGGQPHDNLQPYLTLVWCISLSGVFPARS